MRKIILAVAVAAGALLAGCGVTPPAEQAKTFVEEVAYWDGQAVGARTSVLQLTCEKGYDAQGLCLEAGRPLAPAAALPLLEALRNARGGLRAALTIPEQGVGVCMGQQRTPAECLAQATQMLLDVELALRKAQGG